MQVPLQALFLDIGNTLLYEEPSRFEIYARSARDAGIEVASDVMRGLMVDAHRELPREIDGHYRYTDGWFDAYIHRIFHENLGVPVTDLEELSRELFARFSDPETFRIFDGADELFELVDRHDLIFGVISNWSPRLPRILDSLDLSRQFDFVLSSAIEELEKPDPALFTRALALAGCDARAAMHAGDHLEKDVAAAERVGISAAHVDHDGPSPPAEGVSRVTSLGELATLVASRIA